ncbi:golgin subfamily A member 6-like protein 22 [Camponotus floridanus]|uniref:golgin subfamily A member 6-like protein 22 n=1 Tax=Camponotus floridanus TaxID=104421 RepID=UPI000DC6BD07|nr:golgin subfamily A member 6-like protein 22 [Camponotus floridanus]
MTSTTKEIKITVSGGSDTPEAGVVSGMVPARSTSSSDAGLLSALSAGADGQVATAAYEKEESQVGMLSKTASCADLSRSSSRVSLRSICSMDVDRDSRKRSRVELEKGSEKEDEDPEDEEGSIKNRKIARRGAKKIIDDEDISSSQEGCQMSVQGDPPANLKMLARHTLLSDDDEAADCYVVTGPERKKGEEVRIGVLKEERKLGTVIKRGRGRPKKIHRKKIGIEELGVHEVEDSEDSEGYDVLSAPEMAATAIEYLEEADQIRIRCKNIKGDLSGVMKRRIHNTKEIIKGLARTITKVPQRKEGGDEEDETCFLRMENKELKTRLREKEKDCQKKEKEIQILRNEVKEIGEQMKLLKEEIMEMKRNYGKTTNAEGSPKDRNERRMHRTLKAIENGEDTSIAEDSEAMESERVPTCERLPTCEWSGVEDDLRFKKPYPVNPGPSISRGGSLLPKHLKQKEKEQLTRKAIEETLKEYKEIRDQVRKYGTIAQEEQTGIGVGSRNEYPELPKPQRSQRMMQPRSIRTDIKVVENIQIRKPRIESLGLEKETKRKEETIKKETTKKDLQSDQEWETKKSRREIKENKKKVKEEQKLKQDKKSILQQQKEKPKMVRRLPRSSAVTLRIAEENKDKYSYADILRKAREKISLEEIGIEKTRIRKTAGGNVLIAIPGANRGMEADRLAEELTKVLDKEITVSRPNIMGELRLFGLDDSISKEEIMDTIAAQGKCKLSEIRASEIKIMRNGLGMIWVKCPLHAAAQLFKIGKIEPDVVTDVVLRNTKSKSVLMKPYVWCVKRTV